MISLRKPSLPLSLPPASFFNADIVRHLSCLSIARLVNFALRFFLFWVAITGLVSRSLIHSLSLSPLSVYFTTALVGFVSLGLCEELSLSKHCPVRVQSWPSPGATHYLIRQISLSHYSQAFLSLLYLDFYFSFSLQSFHPHWTSLSSNAEQG